MESCEWWTTTIRSRIKKILNENSKLASIKWAEYASNEKFQVQYNAGTVLHAMDLGTRTCTYLAWQLSGILCCCVIVSVVSRGLDMMEFVDDIYKNDTYLMTYTQSIFSITTPNS